MKLKKIIAAVAAAAVAASMVAVNAFASEPVAKPNSYENPGSLISAGTALPDSLYSSGVEVTFNLTVNDTNYGWANGSAGILVGGEILTETKYGGTACDADGNRSWFPEGSVVIADGSKTAKVVCKTDLTGKSDFNIFIFSGAPTDSANNGFFTLDSVTIKSAAGFEAKYADGKLVITAGDTPADAAEDTTDDKTADTTDETEADETEEDATDEADADTDDDTDADEADEADDTDASETGNTAADTADNSAAEKPASDNSSTAAKTGNVPAAAMVSVMALAGAAAVVSKKRK